MAARMLAMMWGGWGRHERQAFRLRQRRVGDAHWRNMVAAALDHLVADRDGREMLRVEPRSGPVHRAAGNLAAPGHRRQQGRVDRGPNAGFTSRWPRGRPHAAQPHAGIKVGGVADDVHRGVQLGDDIDRGVGDERRPGPARHVHDERHGSVGDRCAVPLPCPASAVAGRRCADGPSSSPRCGRRAPSGRSSATEVAGDVDDLDPLQRLADGGGGPVAALGTEGRARGPDTAFRGRGGSG